jgi:hypothetical protein
VVVLAVITHGARKKIMASAIMLVSCELWNERNARVFHNKSSVPSIIVGKIKGVIKN